MPAPRPYPGEGSIAKNLTWQEPGAHMAAEAESSLLQVVEEGPPLPRANLEEPVLQPGLARQVHPGPRARLPIR